MSKGMKGKAVAYLKKAGLDPKPLPRGFDFDGRIAEAFEIMLPEQYISYDDKCISSIDDYIDVFIAHLDLAEKGGEVSDVKIIHRKNGKVCLGFRLRGEDCSIRFSHDESRWIDQSFYSALNGFTRKLMKWEFLDFDEDLYSASYLPCSVVRKLKRFVFLSEATADEICKRIKQGVSIGSINWNLVSPNVASSFDSEGETIGTRCVIEGAVRHKDDMEILLNCTCVDMSMPNAKGITPYMMARSLGRRIEIEYFESDFEMATPVEEFEKRVRKSSRSKDSIVWLLPDHLSGMYIKSNVLCGLYTIARSDRYLDHEDCLKISCEVEIEANENGIFSVEKQDKYMVENLAVGNNAKRFKKSCNKAELIEILKLYREGVI